MKKIFLVSLFILIRAFSFGGNSLVIEAGPVPDIVIDAELKETLKTGPFYMHNECCGSCETTVMFYIGYNSQHIYLYAEMPAEYYAKSTFTAESIPYGPCAELYLSTEAQAKKTCKREPGGSDYLAAFTFSDKPETWVIPSQAPLNGLIYKQSIDKDKFIFEAAIPWFNFRVGCLCKINGRSLPFNFVINTGKAKHIYSGTAEDYKSPAKWGKIRLGKE